MPAALYQALSAHAEHTSSHAAPGIVSRAIGAIRRAQVRRAERDIARFIENRGGRMTDELERRIEHHFV